MSVFIKPLIVAGLIACGAATLIGRLALWFPILDMLNNGVPIYAALGLMLLLLALWQRTRGLMIAAAVLVVFNTGIMAMASGGTAPAAPAETKRFLRIVTFNLFAANTDMEQVAAFLKSSGADIVLLQEFSPYARARLKSLDADYPYRTGDESIVIYSKYPPKGDGRIDRAGFGRWNTLLMRWASFEIGGKPVDIAAAHLARPYYSELQGQDLQAITQFAATRTTPLIVAGDFNLTPWTGRLMTFTERTKLGRMNTFHPTWPMTYGSLAVPPLFPIDNVFLSWHFAAMSLEAGPRLGSDHRPLIADIALGNAEPPQSP